MKLPASNGMRLMQEDAIEKLHAGLTTLEEILRVVPIETVSNLSCTKCRQTILPSFKLCPYCGTRCSQRSSSADARQDDAFSQTVLQP